MRRIVMSLWLAVLTGACLSSPQRPTDDTGADDARIDGPVTDGPVTDAAPSDAPVIDAAIVGPGMTFPPAATAINITAGWSGDLNGDGIDDVILASNTGDDSTTGFYVLFGQAGGRLANYHHFFQTGPAQVVGVTATNLDGSGGLDIVAYTVDFMTTANGDEQARLRAYLADGTDFATPVVNNINAATSLAWKAPFVDNRPSVIFTAQLVAGALPSIVVIHTRGGFSLNLTSWSASAFASTNVVQLPGTPSGSTGGGAFPNSTTATVDDIIVWNDGGGDMSWLVNDGSGSLTPTTVNGVVRGPVYATVTDLDGEPPLEVVRIALSDLTAVPIDTDVGTVGGNYNGQGYIDGVGTATSLLVFDTDSADPRPEILFTAEYCNSGGSDPCIFMVRNPYLDDMTGNLLAGTGERQYVLPTGFDARLMFRGDYDDDGNPEIMVFAADGGMACARAAEGLFAACD